VPYWAALPDGTRPGELVRYVPPARRTFELQDVSIAGRGGELAGTLTIPAGVGPFPAVLFLSGTGTHDRHGISGGIDIGTHEIVDHLAEHGFVGLRFDTRGAGATKLGDEALDSSMTPLVEHARTWFAYLASRPEVDPARIALIGHSQGGTIALLISTQDPVLAPAAIALLAAPGRPFTEILEEQIVQQSTELGIDDAARDQQVAEFREIVAAVKAGTKFEAGAVPDRLVPAARRVAWIRDHLDIDPVDLVPKLRCRLLVAQGAKDFQVTQRDAERLHRAAVTAGLDVAYELLLDLDHLFKRCAGKSTLEQYYDTTRHVDAAFLAKLAAWLGA
jgi:dienelactone hydrolase